MYVPYAVDFDGSANQLKRTSALTGEANTKVGTCSVWIRIDGAGSLRHIFDNYGSFFFIRFNADNTLTTSGWGVGPKRLNIDSASAYAASPNWLHIAMSWDLANAKAHLYINGVDDATNVTAGDEALDHTRDGVAVGSRYADDRFFNGAMADFYLNLAEYVDLSVAANLAKFVTSNLKPVDLGSDGSTPTGTAPIIYMKFAPGAIATNSGTGGDIAVVSSPTDTFGPITPRMRRTKGRWHE